MIRYQMHVNYVTQSRRFIILFLFMSTTVDNNGVEQETTTNSLKCEILSEYFDSRATKTQIFDNHR